MKAVPAARVLIATIGSLGDLHPCLALGLEMQRRGHRVTIAAAEFYRGKISALGLGFHPMRPHWDPTDAEMIARCEDLKRGFEVLFRELVLPELRDTYEDLLAAAGEADLMLAGEMVFAAPLVAERQRLRWASIILSPCSFISAHDVSVLPNAPWLIHVRKAGWRAYRAVFELLWPAFRHWWKPIRDFRRELGLREECDPLRRDKFSPDLVLALFTPLLAQPQPDWPSQTLQPGYVFYDRLQGDEELAPELAAFLAVGEAPIVFTQGSAAVHNPGDFYATSIAAAKHLKRRAVLIGADASLSAPEILAVPYAPYSLVFPRAAAIVHQGGSGTTGQALLAGRPMLIVPYGWDQPDNGARVERLGVGLSLPRSKYSATGAAAALRRLLTETPFAERASVAASQLQREAGVTAACDALEELLAGAQTQSSGSKG